MYVSKCWIHTATCTGWRPKHLLGVREESFQDMGKMTFTGLFFFCMLMNKLTDARSLQDRDDPYQEAAALPYWPFSSSDFWSYVEYFRTLGAYNRINDMARAFFAQFPFGTHLGYHVRDHEQ
ncbi:otospiralin isoform X2 [Hirundo rustica]|uniref:otospiralin isoform X2 n=1 Tax=Hirundo rustica TaxID=43150 RepID=UPI001A949619|nr:otospiralin isoform X2 [Hirundo rustica]